MTSNREKTLWKELGRRDFLLALVGMGILVLIYLVVGGVRLDDKDTWHVARTLLLDVIANLIPVVLAFMVSYAVLRRIQELRTEREIEELASLVSLKIANIASGLTQEFIPEKFTLHSAKYLAKSKSVDVTENIRLRVLSGERVIPVNNYLAQYPQDLGGDPCVGEPKRLTVEYTYDGEKRSRTIVENGILFLP